MATRLCGRYKLAATGDEVAEFFGLGDAPALTPRYNIAPTQTVPVVRRRPEGAGLEAAFMRWGLVPSWAQDLSIGSRMINARAETVAEKPAFRHAVRHRRCLVPADGFYEWRKDGPRKLPYLFRVRDGGLFAFAGLWERWSAPDVPAVETFTILTTTPNDLVAPLHDRMPVIVDRENHARWLDPDASWADDLQPLVVPFAAANMEAYAVSTLVNRPGVDDPRCAEPW